MLMKQDFFWRVLPNKTLVSAQERNASGAKLQKDRITLLACTNATGAHKLKPVMIGKYKKPRAFKNANMEALPVHYVNQKMHGWTLTFLKAGSTCNLYPL